VSKAIVPVTDASAFCARAQNVDPPNTARTNAPAQTLTLFVFIPLSVCSFSFRFANYGVSIADQSWGCDLLKTATGADLNYALNVVPEAVAHMRAISPVTAGTAG
jgi:hypothetical protein